MATEHTATHGGDTGGTGTWSMVEGILLVILGLVAVFSPYAAAAAVVLLFPFFLLIKGILEIVVAFRARTGWLMFWHALFAAVSIIAGIVLLARPLLAGVTILLLLVAYFFVDGIVRIILSLSSRQTGWGWVLASGIIDILLGAFLVTQPVSVSAFVLGFLLGLSILFAGAAMIAVGNTLRHGGATGGVSPA